MEIYTRLVYSTMLNKVFDHPDVKAMKDDCMHLYVNAINAWRAQYSAKIKVV